MKSKIFVLVGVLLVASSMAFAGSACATPTIVPADGRIVDFDFVAPSSSNFYQFSLKPGHSYSIEARQDYDDVNGDLTSTVFADGGTCAAPVGFGATAGTLKDTSASEPAMPANTFRASITIPSTGAPVAYALKIANGNASTGRYVSVKVTETTLFSTLYENLGNSGCPAKCFETYFTFVNLTSQPVTAVVQLFSTLGVSVGVPATLSLPANGSVVTNTSANGLNAPSNSFGYALVSHNGPPGAIFAAGYLANFSTSPAFTEPVPVEEIHVK